MYVLFVKNTLLFGGNKEYLSILYELKFHQLKRFVDVMSN